MPFKTTERQRAYHREWRRAKASRVAISRVGHEIAGEEWRPIPGFEGHYDASDCGRIRRVLPGKGTWAGRILKCVTHKSGYLYVYLNVDGVKHSMKVHRLVGASFLNMPLVPQNVINHLDGDRANNRVVNLEWTMAQGNARHANDTGLRRAPKGDLHPRRKLSAVDVLGIRASHGLERAKDLAERYHVSEATVFEIWEGRTWRHLLAHSGHPPNPGEV